MGSYDLIVIGAGINGAGIARDASLRGLKVLVLDQGDFGGGASNASSGFIHGGARYLTSNLHTTRQSCQDSGAIQKIAPHLVYRIPLIYPVTSRWQGLLVESFFSAYDSFSRHRNGKPHCWLTRSDLQTLMPGINPEVVGAVTFDEWSVMPHRLVMANVIDAVAHGAEVRNYCKVTQLITETREGRRAVTGVVAADRMTGERMQYSATMVCNATGPWSMDFSGRQGLTVKLRPAKGLHIVIPREVYPFGVMCHAIDGRLIFFVPHSGATIVGTTDDDTFELPEDVVPQLDEISYLQEGVSHLYPNITRESPGMTYWGVRPTLYGRGQYEDDLSREHQVFDHAKRDGVDGMVSIAGGKLATYRIMSEETTTLICKKLGVRARCSTADKLLHGADPIDLTRECPTLTQLNSDLVKRLYHRYGSDITVIEAMIQEKPSCGRILDPLSLLTEAEVRYVVQREWVKTLTGVGRRTTWGTTQSVAHDAAMDVVKIVAEELSWDGEQQVYEVNRFFEGQERAISALGGWRQEVRP